MKNRLNGYLRRGARRSPSPTQKRYFNDTRTKFENRSASISSFISSSWTNFKNIWGRFSSWPAGIIDRMYLRENNDILRKAYTFVATRFIYVGLFVPLLTVDVVTSLLTAMAYSTKSFWTTDDIQDQAIAQQKKYTNIFSKSVYCLLASPMGLFSSKLIAFYFIPEQAKKKGVSAGGDLYHAPDAKLEQPATEEALQDIVRNATAQGTKIMPVGAGRSQGKQFLPEGQNAVVIDLKNLSTIHQINAEDKTITVGAGARWIDIQVAIDKSKMALQVMQASNIFSVGGSIGTNIHGWDHRNGSLSNVILEMDVITADGKKQTLTPADDLFHQVTGGLGLYGIVTRVKLKLQDNQMLKEVGTDVKTQDYVQHFRDTVQKDPNIRMHLYRLSLDPKKLLSSGVAVDYVADEKDAKPVTTPGLKPEGEIGTRFDRIMINLARRFGWIRGFYWNYMESKRLVANKSEPMTTNAIMQPPINAMFNNSVSETEWLQEYFLPGDKLDAFLKDLGKILMDNEVPLLNASVRFVKQNEKSPLSYAQGGDRFAVVICFYQSLNPVKVVQAKKWIRESQKLTVDHGGAFYLPYQHVSNPEQVQRAYPQYMQAFHAKLMVDRNRTFSSGFSEKYLARANQTPEFRHLMNSSLNRDKFKGFLKVVFQQVDADELYALLDDVLKYNDSHAEVYAELCRRLNEIKPSTLSTLRRILSSLSDIKRDLADQAKILLNSKTEINGLIEIGYPGRFIGGFKKNFKVKGPVIAVYEQQSLSDYVQTGIGPRPYDQFVKLDYSNPAASLEALPDASADVITCYVGLHHFKVDEHAKPDELDKFLIQVRRVLRDGGQFLLVDHDVKSDSDRCMAIMAHSIFNAVTGVSLEEEMGEVRNFQSMEHWKALLAKHGLGYSVKGPDVALIRDGDPSRNRMVSFTRAEPKLDMDEVKDHGLDTQNPDWRRMNANTQKLSSLTQGLHTQPLLAPTLATGGSSELKQDNDGEFYHYN